MAPKRASAPGETGATLGDRSVRREHSDRSATEVDNQAPLERWLRVGELVAAEGIGSRREVYHAIDLGMPHSRIGRRIRVRRSDWHRWHLVHLVGGAR